MGDSELEREGGTTGTSWSSIQDLPEDWAKLASRELPSLAQIWREQREKLSATDVLSDFNAKMCREWAIETGIIEDLYSLDRGTTQVLIERGIEASFIPHDATNRPIAEVVGLLRDQESVVNGLFDFVAQRRVLGASYVKEIHAAFTANQKTTSAIDRFGHKTRVDLRRGDWKILPNNPTRQNGSVHSYCPPEHVNSEMDRLFVLHLQHNEKRIPVEVEAAWLHHRFTQIHPFQDGNGRVARALASLIFLKEGWFPLIIHRDHRALYISTLERADLGDLGPLVNLFAKTERKSFLKALSVSESVLREHVPVQDLISSAVDRLQARLKGHREKQKGVFRISSALEDYANERLGQVANSIQVGLAGVSRQYRVDVDRNTGENAFWFKSQIVLGAKEKEYFADTRTYATWVRMRIFEERQATLVLSFHSVGVEFVGVLACAPFLEFRDRAEDGQIAIDGPYSLSDEVFQFAFNEKQSNVIDRFGVWINDVLIAGLEQWRRQI